jgi:hypothetical protein
LDGDIVVEVVVVVILLLCCCCGGGDIVCWLVGCLVALASHVSFGILFHLGRQVEMDLPVAAMGAGAAHSAAVTEDGKVFAWGTGRPLGLGKPLSIVVRSIPALLGYLSYNFIILYRQVRT